MYTQNNNINLEQLIGKSVFASILIFILLYTLSLIKIEIYTIIALIITIILFTDISYLLKKENFLKNPFLYLDILLLFTAVYAPIQHFFTDHWLVYIYDGPKDWTPYANKLSFIYFIGILLLILTRSIVSSKKPNKTSNIWISRRASQRYIYPLMLISFLIQTYIYISLGGVTGYILNYEEEGFSGYGLLFIISELFPLLFILVYFIKTRNKTQYKKAIYIYIFLLFLFIFCLYFGGLRGSRSNTLWTLIHAFFLIHIYIRKFTLKELALIGICCFMFLFIGKVYKNTRGSFITNTNISFTENTDRVSASRIFGGDISRYSIQAYLIYRYDQNKFYCPKLGITYIGDITKMTPIIKNEINLPDKVSAGTELMYGLESYNSGIESSRVYGILGEFILNFGIILSPFVFIILGLVVCYINNVIQSFSDKDIRVFLIPVFINLVFLCINSDLDNIFFFSMKRILPLFIVLFCISVKKQKTVS